MSSSAQSVFERTMRAIGKPGLISDERFLDNRRRGVNWEALDAEISEWCRRHTLDEAMAILLESEAAAAPVYSVAEVVADPHFTARGSIVAVDDPNLGPVRMQAPSPRLSRSPGEIRSTGPKLGEHNGAVYGALLGLGEAELARLKQQGTI
jgi:crotonobetainyl-CoA:carnitine CoA-transferase CaiB-like acyl-CoA transferase